jgi:ABC-type Mn2+/Zn2+ transport system permease subunit
MMAWAILFGALSMYSGLLISYHFDLAAGAAIILVAIVIFFVVFILQNIRQRRIAPSQEATHG